MPAAERKGLSRLELSSELQQRKVHTGQLSSTQVTPVGPSVFSLILHGFFSTPGGRVPRPMSFDTLSFPYNGYGTF